MNRVLSCGAASLSLFVAGLCAQGQTWIVDAESRPGAHFADIASAVAAAHDGDVIRVRASAVRRYLGATVTKGLSILAEPGARMLEFSNQMTIENVPAGAVAVVKGLTWDASFFAAVAIRNNAGRVHLDRISVNSGLQPAVAIDASRVVSLEGCVIVGGPAVMATNSTVTLSGCDLRGANGIVLIPPGLPGAPALDARDATVVFARGQMTGGDGSMYFQNTVPPAEAIVSRNSRLVIAGDTATIMRAGGVIPVPKPAITGQGGSLTLDPNVQVVPYLSAPPIAGTIAVTTAWLPALHAHGAAPGQVVHADLFSRPGDVALFVTSLASPPIAVGTEIDFWLDPLAFFVTGVGVVGPIGHLTHDIPLALDPNLAFGAWTLQAVSGTFADGFKMANAVTYALD